MAEKFNVENLSLKELANHLRQPKGEDGKIVGEEMNKANKHICLNSYKVLNPNNDDSILEIGMANGFFVKDLMSMNNNLKYVGIDFSKTMVNEAIKINQKLMSTKKVSFIDGSIEKLPFKDDSFECITTTNTIYFWPNLAKNTEEIYRALKPNGKLLIGYRSKEFMDKIELSKYGFNKFESNDIKKLLEKVGFRNILTKRITEPDLDFDGKPLKIVGLYTTGVK
jgi:ubiquinone/menaquinone biosynthesis C-methylase UbiE